MGLRQKASRTRRILTASIRPRIGLDDAEEWSKDHIAPGLSFSNARSKLTLSVASAATPMSATGTLPVTQRAAADDQFGVVAQYATLVMAACEAPHVGEETVSVVPT
jgi:hypothetical protein